MKSDEWMAWYTQIKLVTDVDEAQRLLATVLKLRPKVPSLVRVADERFLELLWCRRSTVADLIEVDRGR